jgi:hypothetical protein
MKGPVGGPVARRSRCYAGDMDALKAQVRNGRITVNEKTDLPDGEIYLVPVGVDDEMDEQERAALLQSIDEGLEAARAGQYVDADEVIAELLSSR